MNERKKCNDDQAIPLNIIKDMIQLLNIFTKLFKINDVYCRAYAMTYLYNFYKKTKKNPHEYALYTISSLNLSFKVCNTSISYSKFIMEIEYAKRNQNTPMMKLLNSLGGLPYLEGKESIAQLNDLFARKEIDIIIALNFNLNIVLPYDVSIPFIEKILSWHIKKSSPIFQQLKEELVQKCWIFLNDLQYKIEFYTYSSEEIALPAIELTFFLLDLPLVSPNNRIWIQFLSPSIIPEIFTKLTNQFKQYFSIFFQSKSFDEKAKLNTPVKPELFFQFINYPIIPLQETPISPPPDIELIEKIVKDSIYFKKYDADHIPRVPPPSITITSPNLLQIKEEYSYFLRNIHVI